MTTQRAFQENAGKLSEVPTSGRPARSAMCETWTSGYSFAGCDTRRQYVLSQNDCERLDNLIGLAVMDKTVCEQLVVNRDPVLLSKFGLSQQTRDWLASIEANTLEDFAQAIVSVSSSPRQDPGSPEAAQSFCQFP